MTPAGETNLTQAFSSRKGRVSGKLDAEAAGTLATMGSKPAAEPRKARILIVEDHPFVREGLVLLINRQVDLTCCGEANSVAGASVAAVGKANPDLLLLDLQLGDGDGFEVINRLRPQFPHLAILILSHCGEAAYAEQALRAGARGYVVKQEAAEEVLVAIRAVLRGEIYVSRDLTGRLLQKLVNAAEFYAGPLSPRFRPRKIS